MSLLLPPDYPHVARLLQLGADVRHSPEEGVVRIAIVNIMPQAELYELLLLNRLARSPFLVEPMFFRVVNHRYGSSDAGHLSTYYRTLLSVWDEKTDAVLLTGAPVEHLSPAEIHYFDEIDELMNRCRTGATPLLGLCWGGLAVASFLGVATVVHPHKISGVYESQNLEPDHTLMAGCDRKFYCPQSRYASLNEEDVTRMVQKGQVVKLAKIAAHGTFLIESSDRLFTAHLGHPEYLPERILFEYHRDRQTNPSLQIHGFDPEKPIDRWSDDANRFFNSWMRRAVERRMMKAGETSVPGKKEAHHREA